MDFTLQDVLELPEHDLSEVTRTFATNDKEYTLTVFAGAKYNADRFYTLRELMTAPVAEEQMGRSVTPIVVTLPGGTRSITVSNAGYIGLLSVLENVSIKPNFNIMEWAIFGSRVGPEVMDEIFDWITDVNGLTSWFQKQVDHAKNGLGGMPGKNGYSAPASNISTGFRNRSSKRRTSKV